MKNKFFLGLLTIVFVTTLSSCNKAPQTEIDATKTAISEAQAIGADVYLPEEFMAMNDSLDAIMLNIESKKSKWFTNYDSEKEQLNNIMTLATTVKQNTETRKDEIKNEIMASLVEIRTLLDENQVLLTQAPKGKEGTAALIAIKDELSLLSKSIDDVMKMVSACNTGMAERDIAILLALVDTGCRASEFLAIDVGNLNLIEGDIQILQGKGGKFRTVYLGRNCRRKVRKYLKTRKEVFPHSPLWVNNGGYRLTYSGLRQIIRRRAGDANVKTPVRLAGTSVQRSGQNHHGRLIPVLSDRSKPLDSY